MLSLFRKRLPIDDDELEFQLATFKWLIGEFGDVAETRLVLPTPDFFPSDGRGGVEILFEEVRAAAGMAEWACRLEAGAADRPVDAGNAHLLRHEGSNAPCGTFRVEHGPDGPCAIVTYNPGMEESQADLVATFAHELGHFLMATAKGTPPGGWDLHELHTDLAAVYLGFGIFLANGARSFSQFQSGGYQGWSSRTQGYLSEGALVTATVIVERLAGRDSLEAGPWLKDYLRKDLTNVAGALARRHPDLAAAIAAIDLSEFSSD